MNPLQLMSAFMLLGLLFSMLVTFLRQQIFTRKEFYHNFVRSFRHLEQEIRDILNPPGANIETLLTERANSNQRLIRALQISNTFVSPDVVVHDQFVKQARQLLNAAKRRGWESLQFTAIEAVKWQLEHGEDKPNLRFDSFVQNITLVVVLMGILQIEEPVDALSYDDITLVANQITTLWSLSKKSDPIPPIILQQLQAAIRRLVIDEDRFPDPLNFVIPSWETLWRVVATTVAYSCRDQRLYDTFHNFNVFPSEDSFGQGQGDISVQSIVFEAMRLHPPSRHIGRLRHWMWCPNFVRKWVTVKKSADIEGLLRCDIWGADSDRFAPSRFRLGGDLIGERETALRFVFGHGPLKCIASSWAPMAAAVVSGAILKQLGESGLVIESGPEIGGRGGWNGWSVTRIIL